MDKHDIQYAERMMRHIRGVQDHMLYLLANHSVDLELTKEDEWKLFQNAVKHDLSKWTSEQFKPYVDKFMRKVDAPGFDAAWRAHYMTENHHYQNGRWLGKLEVIEICCDLQAMADEFGEGSAFGFWDSKWRPEFTNWLNDLNGPAGFTDVRRQMTDDYQFRTTMMHMRQIFEWLNERRDNGEMQKGMNLVKALQILERNQEAMGHAKSRKFRDDELIAILTYRQAMNPNDGADFGGTLDSFVRCPVCQRGDVWQEAVSRTQYVYKGEAVKDGQEVIDYLLAEVAVLLETQNRER